VEQLASRVEVAKQRLEALERAADELESVQRVRAHLQRQKAASASLKTAPTDYYSWTLSQRA
jgi:hypothetical protein